ncbi:phosphoesterase [Silvibacterium dinghuense]|uniref:Phosphoesterase n=2 Tax=Silvibacterium dinghuense TaxID=1560006 RepID=A0A4Q1SEL7_9BACT|nr:phosphoesterase [Silvibacterium dinghuense]
MGTAWSPDGRYLALVNAGFGTAESDYAQSISVLDTTTGKVTDFPDTRTLLRARQTMYSGIAFSGDGQHLYVSFDSLSAPEGGKPDETGNAIAVYGFHDGQVKPERLIPVPLQRLAPGRIQNQVGKPISDGMANPVPTGLAVLAGPAGHDRLLVADEFSDDVLLLDASNGRTLIRFDLASRSVVPSAYPIAVVATKDNRRAFVALWNDSTIAELDLKTGRVTSKTALLPPVSEIGPSSHPVAMTLSPDEKTLYVALANRDGVAAVSVAGKFAKVTRFYDSRLPGQRYFGAMPDAVAVSADGTMLYAANSGSDAVAVFRTRAESKVGAPEQPIGFLPTEWYPSAMAIRGDKLYVATAKGQGTGPNAAPQPPAKDPTDEQAKQAQRPHTYIATMLHGSLATIDLTEANKDLERLTGEVLRSNLMQAAQTHLAFAGGANPIRHVIYIIKENRTYDQILGDLAEDGKPVGNGDSSLTMYGAAITPNQHKLALQFGVFDNFYDSGEVSGDGHVWSTAGITSDYTERDWPQSYRGAERTYDFEGVVQNGYPIQEKMPDINEPASGYLWTDLAKHDKTLYHFGEFISTKFCDDSGEAPKEKSPLEGTPEPTHFCEHAFIDPGAEIPTNYGGGKNPYPWKIPMIYRNVATKPELEGHFDPQYPDFNLSFPDQLRMNEFLNYFNHWVEERKAGHDEMPNFVMLRFPNDHTFGTRVGKCTPKACIADNDLAVGRAVEAVSNSPYWDDTAFFILEDDAQDGADHVDAHRSLALVVSKYSPRNPAPLVDSTFYTTVSVLRTMEDLLGIPPMNNNDAFAPLMAPAFTGEGNQPPFRADYSNRDNGLIYTANTPASVGAKESSKLDFSHEDRANPAKLNVILWKDAMGAKPVPAALRHPAHKQDDGDD